MMGYSKLPLMWRKPVGKKAEWPIKSRRDEIEGPFNNCLQIMTNICPIKATQKMEESLKDAAISVHWLLMKLIAFKWPRH